MVADPVICWRRWIASRVAWACCDASAPSGFDVARVRVLLENANSDDAQVALRGLSREAEVVRDARAPGFRGPDEWFAA